MQQSKNVDTESRRLEHLIKFLKDSNNVCEFIIALVALNGSKLSLVNKPK